MQRADYRYGEKPLHEYLREHARRQPDKAAYIWYGATISYGELNRQSDAFAAHLSGLGIRQGDRVALFMQNCPQYVIAHFGIQKIGAIVAPCGPLSKAHELEYQLSDLGAKIIVTAENLYPVVAAIQDRTAVRHVFLVHYADLLPEVPTINAPEEIRVLRTNIPGTTDFLAIVNGCTQNPAPGHVPAMDDVALMTYTSGTTGMPKGAMLTYGNALFKTSCAADCNGVTNEDVLLAIVPLYHIAGMLMGLNVTIYTGATTVLCYRFDPLVALQAIERYRVSWWYSIAPMNVAVMHVPDARRFDLSSLNKNVCTSFGITLTEELANQWGEFAGGKPIHEAAYGLSETHTCDTFMPGHAIRWGTQGIPCPGVAMRIVDPDSGRDLPADTVGEVVLLSPGNFKGYWNKPEETAATQRNGWVHTGDMGKLDSDGYLTFMGRFKEMIKVSGYSVFPDEVEAILSKHPAVAQIAVIGIPDPAKGEVVKAVIVLKPDAKGTISADEFIAWSRENLSAYKVPRSVEFRDSLTATATGKVLRRLAKEPQLTM